VIFRLEGLDGNSNEIIKKQKDQYRNLFFHLKSGGIFYICGSF